MNAADGPTGGGRPRVERNEVFDRMDAAHHETCRLERERLRAILECDRHELWRNQGSRDHAQFLAARYGISEWKARRWIGAAYALEHLPVISHALSSGTVSLDKAVELTRFATPATEKKLVGWARHVTPGGIRRRADAETHKSLARAQEADADRHLSWWWHLDGMGLEIEGRLPAPEGAVFISAIDRLAKDLPAAPIDEEASTDDYTIDRRRADALALLASARVADDHDPDRATVVVHAPYESLVHARGNAAIAGGPAIHAETGRRLACDGRIEVALHGRDGRVVGVGRTSREPPHWLRRQVLSRDSFTCTFPGCEMKRFLHVHHMHDWELGGPTDLDNLITVCTLHHKLVHEYRWSVTLDGDAPVWFRPSGRRFEPGPSPPAAAKPQASFPATGHATPWPALWHLIQNRDHALTRDASMKRLLKLGDRRFG